jgi:hypothetical protein
MIIGSTNSLTYQHPQSWWKRVIGWYNKHQEVDYEIQYKFYGVRLFEFKLYVNKNKRIVVRSGNAIYSIFSLYEILDFFNKMGDVTLLITLDETYDEYMLDYNHAIENKFKESCRIIETIYKDIMLCGGYREFDRKHLYQFDWERDNGMPKIMAPDEWSKVYRFIQRWCPFLLKKLNRYYIKKYEHFNGFLMLSYVNRR